MAGSDRPPEQVIRDWLEGHGGSVTVGIAALEETWKVERLSPRERKKVERALKSAGVVATPSLAGASRSDRIELSLDPDRQVSGVREQDEPRTVRLGLVALAVGLMVVGALGPWAKNIFATDYGLDRNGAYVIGAAGLATLVLAIHARRGRPSRLPMVAALLGAVAVGIVASDFRDVLDDSFVEPDWGIYAAAAGSALLVALSMSLLVRRE